jgi:truncated hemoglobin YjbI
LPNNASGTGRDSKMAQILLETYLGTQQFDDFLDQFYDAVTQHDLVKHFFIVAKKPAVIQDLKRYWPYLLPKSTLEYRKPAVPSSSYEIQLPESQFSEIVIMMTKLFREMKFSSEHAPQLIHEILELIEETRSQTADTASTTLEGKDIDPEILHLFLKRHRIQSEVMPSKALKTVKGLEYESWIRLDHEEKEIRIYGKIFIKDEAFDDQLTEIIEKQADKESIVKLRLVRDSGPQHLYASHTLPFNNGIPMRLFTRCLQRFCADLAAVHSFDKESILKKKT